MRLASLWIVLCACEPTFRPPVLPELVAAPAKPQPITSVSLYLVPGESMIWDVHAQGFTIARAVLDVGDGEVRSRFRTNKLASRISNVSHDLMTTIRAGRATEATETVRGLGLNTSMVMRFTGSRIATGEGELVVPNGNLGHTLHSALGAIRGWASPDASPGYLYVVLAGELFRLDVSQPIHEKLQDKPTLRIDARIRTRGIGITIWLRPRDRVPLRVEIRADDGRITAELVPT